MDNTENGERKMRNKACRVKRAKCCPLGEGTPFNSGSHISGDPKMRIWRGRSEQ